MLIRRFQIGFVSVHLNWLDLLREDLLPVSPSLVQKMALFAYLSMVS